jgi:membrane protein
MHMAAGMAYYALFSLFPLVLATIALASFFVSSDEAQVRLLEFLDRQFPGAGTSQILQENVRGLVQARGALSLVSVLVLFVTSRAVFSALQRVVNRAWGVPRRRHFLVQQVREGAMAFAAGLVLLASVSLSAFGQVIAQGPGLLGIRLEFIVWAWATLFGLVPLFLSTFVFLLVFRFVPAVKARWAYVAPPAVLTGIVFELSKIAFVWYLDNFASFDRVYGGISAIVVLLLWTYVACVILVIGTEVASEYSKSVEQGMLRWRGGLRLVTGGLGPRRGADG